MTGSYYLSKSHIRLQHKHKRVDAMPLAKQNIQ